MLKLKRGWVDLKRSAGCTKRAQKKSGNSREEVDIERDEGTLKGSKRKGEKLASMLNPTLLLEKEEVESSL